MKTVKVKNKTKKGRTSIELSSEIHTYLKSLPGRNQSAIIEQLLRKMKDLFDSGDHSIAAFILCGEFTITRGKQND